MTHMNWSLVEATAQLLGRDEREAVLGDLAESGESVWRELLDVLGLVIRRQAALWTSWRPWLAAFGLALPSSFLLMGFSLSVSWMYRQTMEARVPEANGFAAGPGFLLLIRHIFLLIGLSWTGGFVLGSVSRRTLWASIAATCSPCLFCLSRFGVPSLSRFCLLLFLLPAIWGVRQGLCRSRITLRAAIVLAATLTVLMISVWSSRGPWVGNWVCVLSWPAWYMVATVQRRGRESGQV